MSWDDGKHTKVKRVQLTFDDVIKSIEVEYDGSSLKSQTRGTVGTKSDGFTLSPDEYITEVNGYYKTVFSGDVITALTFKTNKKTYGTYGNKTSNYFSLNAPTNNQITGFLGSSGNALNSIDAHFGPLPPPDSTGTNSGIGGTGGSNAGNPGINTGIGGSGTNPGGNNSGGSNAGNPGTNTGIGGSGTNPGGNNSGGSNAGNPGTNTGIGGSGTNPGGNNSGGSNAGNPGTNTGIGGSGTNPGGNNSGGSNAGNPGTNTGTSGSGTNPGGNNSGGSNAGNPGTNTGIGGSGTNPGGNNSGGSNAGNPGTNPGTGGAGTNPGDNNSGGSNAGTNPGIGGSGTNPGGNNSGGSNAGTNPGTGGARTNPGGNNSGGSNVGNPETNLGISGDGTNPGRNSSGTNNNGSNTDSGLQKVEAQGSKGGNQWDDGADHDGVTKIYVTPGDGIEQIRFDYVKNGQPKEGPFHGVKGNRSFIYTVEINHPDEYLLSVKGCYDSSNNIQGIEFKTNIKTSEYFGFDDGSQFSLEVKDKKIIGFHGLADTHLNSLGAYFVPISTSSSSVTPPTPPSSTPPSTLPSTPPSSLTPTPPSTTPPPTLNKSEAKGGNGGETFDDGVFDHVTKVYVGQGDSGVSYVKFDYEKGGNKETREHGIASPLGAEYFEVDSGDYITSMEVYVDKITGYKSEIITSIAFKTFKGKTSQPFGMTTETKYELKDGKGGKLVGFHGNASDVLYAIGAYFAPTTN